MESPGIREPARVQVFVTGASRPRALRRRCRCQGAHSLEASVPISTKDPRSYLREVTTRNVSIPHFAKVMGHAVVVEATRKLGRLPEPVLRGPEPTSPRMPTLDLEAGDWVRVKQPEEIVGTLN